MKRLLKTSVGALALTMGAGMAMAQSDMGAASGGGTMPSAMTCADIADLDSQEAERRLYFVAGYQAAQDSGMGTGSTAGTTTGGAGETTAGADTGADTGTDTMAGADTTTGSSDTDTTAGADIGADTGTDTTAGADTGADTGTDTMAGADTGADAETDTMAGADSTTGEAGTDTTTTAGTSDSAASGAGGFVDVPVESVMTACEDNPDALVTDILGQQGSSIQ